MFSQGLLAYVKLVNDEDRLLVRRAPRAHRICVLARDSAATCTLSRLSDVLSLLLAFSHT